MKRILGIVILSLGIGSTAFAQTSTPDFSQLGPGFQDFTNDVATSLPFASTMGLNWSWAYIGNLPHLGAGLAAGAVFMPTTGFDKIASAIGMGSLPAPFNDPQLGVPLPAYVAEARLGGIILPFDIGVKVGLIPQQYAAQVDQALGMNVSFHLLGAQLRYALVKEKFLTPAVSVGFAVNHFDGALSMPVGSSLSSSYTYNNQTYTVGLSQPTVNFGWNSNSLDASIEISKKILLLVTPYVGAGLSYGFSTANASIKSTLSINGVTEASDPVAFNNYFNTLQTALAYSGQTQTLSSTDLSFNGQAGGLSARAFGGVSVNLWFIKIDGTLMYNVMNGKLGATIGARAQF